MLLKCCKSDNIPGCTLTTEIPHCVNLHDQATHWDLIWQGPNGNCLLVVQASYREEKKLMVENAKLKNEIEELKRLLLEKEKKRGGM